MNNPDSSTNSEDKGFSAKDVSGNVTYTSTKGNHNVTTVSVGEKINTDIKTISNLDPEFSKSITKFRDLLKENLKDKQATEEQIKKINENIDSLAKELEGIKANQTIEDEDEKDDIKTKLNNLADAIVDIAPDVAEYVASVTPLAPISKAIGKGVGYMSDLIKRKILKK
jgi:predicted ribosome quality control (RQC) complex YloA/Tae2 family protein